jgi:arabinose-5-phosphate isomerase
MSPHLAPTASTTVALALGDALAVALLNMRDFSPEDFALFHPGGSLGKRLLLRVREIMATGERMPVVHQAVSLKDAILEITSKRLGATCVVDGDGLLVGMITDGDLRRLLERDTDMTHLLAVDVMSTQPKTILPDTLASVALTLMERHKITQLMVADRDRHPIGIVHMHDLVQLDWDRKDFHARTLHRPPAEGHSAFRRRDGYGNLPPRCVHQQML